jgi:hypothetical protein
LSGRTDYPQTLRLHVRALNDAEEEQSAAKHTTDTAIKETKDLPEQNRDKDDNLYLFNCARQTSHGVGRRRSNVAFAKLLFTNKASKSHTKQPQRTFK